MRIEVVPAGVRFEVAGGQPCLVVFDVKQVLRAAPTTPPPAVVLVVASDVDARLRRAIARHLAVDFQSVASLEWLIARDRAGPFCDRAGWHGLQPIAAPGRAALILMPQSNVHLLVAEALDVPTVAAVAPARVRWLVGPLSPAAAQASEVSGAMSNVAIDGAVVVTPTEAEPPGIGLSLTVALEALGVAIVRLPRPPVGEPGQEHEYHISDEPLTSAELIHDLDASQLQAALLAVVRRAVAVDPAAPACAEVGVLERELSSTKPDEVARREAYARMLALVGADDEAETGAVDDGTPAAAIAGLFWALLGWLVEENPADLPATMDWAALVLVRGGAEAASAEADLCAVIGATVAAG